MPTSREIVSNRALSGTELKEILLRYFKEHVLDQEGLLSDYIAYGRISYEIRLILHLDNYTRPESTTTYRSRRAGNAEVEANPDLAVVEALPLADNPPDATLSAATITGNITSPNVERIRAGIPVPVRRSRSAPRRPPRRSAGRPCG